MCDLFGAMEREWCDECVWVQTEGWGACLLEWEDEDGLWVGGAFFPCGFTECEWEVEG